MSITITNTQIPGLGGLAVTAYNQGTPTALGPQQSATVQVLTVQTNSEDALNPVTTLQSPLPCTYPSAVTIAEIVCADTSGNYDLVVPFKCQVAGIVYNLGASASSNAADTFLLKKVTLQAGTVTNIMSAAQTLNNTAAYGLVYSTSLNPTEGTLLAGDTLRCTVAKTTHVGGTAIVTLIPVA